MPVQLTNSILFFSSFFRDKQKDKIQPFDSVLNILGPTGPFLATQGTCWKVGISEGHSKLMHSAEYIKLTNI